MTISATSVRFDDDTMWVELTDGRTIGVPLAWFPRLLNATEGERQQVELSRLGLHWEHLDEDISVAGLLVGGDDIEIRAVDRRELEVSRKPRRDELLRRLRAFRGRLPADFKFDREGANTR
jgi:Protein of unknown function (DUF2442)